MRTSNIVIKIEYEADLSGKTPKGKLTLKSGKTNAIEMTMLIECLVEIILKKETKITREEIYQLATELSKSKLKAKTKKSKGKASKKKEVKNDSSSK